MKKVFLYAYDKVNLGDDLFIISIIQRYPNVRFYLWSDEVNKENFFEYKNLKVINKNSFFLKFLNGIKGSLGLRYERLIRKSCDAVVYIGGSIFMEYPTWKNMINWWNYLAKNHNFYVLGANFGPYHTEEYKDEMKEMMKNMKDICFRDKYSYNLFKEVKTVRYAPDILFGYDMPKVQKNKKQIYISLISCKKKENGKFLKYEEQYNSFHKRIVNQFLNDGYEVKLVSFCKEEGDEEAVIATLKCFENHPKKNQLMSLLYNGKNLNIILEELACSEYVLATRFHATVLGMVAGRKVFPIVYSNKTVNLLKDLNFEGNYVKVEELGECNFDFINHNLKKKYVCEISNEIKKSEEHYKILDCQMANNRVKQ